ncbi:putative pyrroline-5-carboxylate reductase [Rosa chinensis]|uniref:Putative pyrroline-5-carboxylate reductase n=1 Tax=Rosa chinensis TaxID=74649 RepID=A0A2P6RTG1_ROSCH|nr:putative pyrroline-5-carboxylate reductase [Rosa chinensis]
MEALPIPTETYKHGFIGAGKLAESIARGVIRSGILRPKIASLPATPAPFDAKPSSPSASTSSLATTTWLKRVMSSFSRSNLKLVFKDVVLQLRPLLSRKKLLISIAAGVKLKDLQDWAGHSRFIRVMPNTPSAVGVAASG